MQHRQVDDSNSTACATVKHHLSLHNNHNNVFFLIIQIHLANIIPSSKLCAQMGRAVRVSVDVRGAKNLRMDQDEPRTAFRTVLQIPS